MKLKVNLSINAHQEIYERMKEMTLAFESELVNSETPILIDGKLTYRGEVDITTQLDQIAGELHNWYYCKC